jgi:hypothetical protein
VAEPDDPMSGASSPEADGGSPGSMRSVAEPRWPMAAAVLCAVILQLVVPSRGRVPGWWVFPVLELVMLALLIVRDPGRIDRRSSALRSLTIGLIAVMTVANSVAAIILLREILSVARYANATLLLGRGAAIWVTNVIVFSLWYWEFDRGGPAERAAGSGVPLSFAFSEDAMPELGPVGWRPRYVDYLYLSFTNATAFSPTDTLPVRTWAKMTMMGQSAVSLVTGILVIARAVNILDAPPTP